MPHKKLMYVPGLISLVALPAILLIFSPEDPERKVWLRMYLPYDDVKPPADGNIRFARYMVQEDIEGKNIISFYLDPIRSSWDVTSYISHQQHKLLEIEMQRLAFMHDTSSVLRVVFSENSDYHSFVRVQNLAIIYGYKRYALVDDSFYFFPNPPPVYYPAQALYPEYLDLGPVNKQPGYWERLFTWMWCLKEKWAYYFKRNYLLAIGFLILILLPALVGLRRIKRNFPPANLAT